MIVVAVATVAGTLALEAAPALASAAPSAPVSVKPYLYVAVAADLCATCGDAGDSGGSEASPSTAAPTGRNSLSRALREDLRAIYTGCVEIDPGEACLLAFAGGGLMLVDQELYEGISSGPRDPTMDRLGDVVTDLGTGVATLGISGLVALSDPKTGYLAANAVIYSGLSCAVLKAAFGRARPGLGEGPYAFSGPCIREGYNSMPSGHSAAAFALATVLARQYPKYRVFFYTGATLVAISRVYEHAHWPSDTLVGAAIGVWSANQVMGRSRLFEITW